MFFPPRDYTGKQPRARCHSSIVYCRDAGHRILLVPGPYLPRSRHVYYNIMEVADRSYSSDLVQHKQMAVDSMGSDAG